MRLAFTTVLVLLLCSCLSDTLDASYDTMADAVSAQAVDKGWIPDWLPSSATNLREVHNLDTNTSALTFDIPAGEVWKLPIDCKPIAFSDTKPPVFDRSWLPSDEIMAASYTLFRCREDFAFVGISKKGDQGLHWRNYY
jgi:hypothetical protein